MRVLLLLALVATTLAACAPVRPHAAVRVTPKGVKVTPALYTNIGGIGVSVSP